jgi:hypothetical protein
MKILNFKLLDIQSRTVGIVVELKGKNKEEITISVTENFDNFEFIDKKQFDTPEICELIWNRLRKESTVAPTLDNLKILLNQGFTILQTLPGCPKDSPVWICRNLDNEELWRYKKSLPEDQVCLSISDLIHTFDTFNIKGRIKPPFE